MGSRYYFENHQVLSFPILLTQTIAYFVNLSPATHFAQKKRGNDVLNLLCKLHGDIFLCSQEWYDVMLQLPRSAAGVHNIILVIDSEGTQRALTLQSSPFSIIGYKNNWIFSKVWFNTLKAATNRHFYSMLWLVLNRIIIPRSPMENPFWALLFVETT